MTDDLTLLAEGALDDVDAAVLTAVHALHARIDPVPAGLTERIKFELTLAALHAEVAELTQLSLAGVRDDSTHYELAETVTFTSSTLTLMVSIGPAGEQSPPDTVRVDGWVQGTAESVELRVGDVSHWATPDENGRFVIDGVPHGSARFVLRPRPTPHPTRSESAERPVITPSIEV